MFWNYVQTIAHLVKDTNPNINGEFYIGMDPIVDFVFFYCITNERQEKQNHKNILEYTKEHFKMDESVLKNLKPEQQEAVFHSVYSKKLYHYDTLNSRNMLNKIQRTEREIELRLLKKEMGQNLAGNAQRFKGIDLYSYQEDEFTTLLSIKEGEHDEAHANRTYKRLVSEKGYLHLLSFKDYTNFVEILKDEISKMPREIENVQIYKLEKTLNFELMKCTAVAINESSKASSFDEESVIKDLLLVFGLPFVADRQKYTLLYPKLDLDERDAWRREVQGLTNFAMDCIKVLEQTLHGLYEPHLTKEDLVRLNSLYSFDSFENQYIQRKHFKSEEFNSILKVLDSMNSNVYEKERKNIKSKQ